MNVFKEIRELDLPKDQYVVVGSSVLVALKIIDTTEDVDITVSKDVFRRLETVGWCHKQESRRPALEHGVYDISTGFGEWNLEDLQADALWLADVPFINPEKLLAWKQQKAREKDIRHIQLIKKYLSENR